MTTGQHRAAQPESDPQGEEPLPTLAERARLRELERENRELKMENEFLKKAAAYVCPER